MTSILWIILAGCLPSERRKEALPSEALPDPNVLRLETLDLDGVEQDYGEPHVNRAMAETPLSINGQIFAQGLATHANSEFSIVLNGAAKRFEAFVGVDDDVRGRASIQFVVAVDGREIVRTPVLRGGEEPRPIRVDLTDTKLLTLQVNDGGDGIYYDHANWADARLILNPVRRFTPHSYIPDHGPDMVIAPFSPDELAIHAPRIVGATPGYDFLFRVPATGRKPLRFSAAGLPLGITLDPATGILTGSLTEFGTSIVEVTVSDLSGSVTAPLTLVGEYGAVALTPPMGWNSWNVWGTAVDDAKVRAAADGIHESGLAAVGFQYVNIDDGWEAGRDADGAILPNEKFPDMKALAQYVHDRGLKLGIYSSPGPLTCAGYEGSYGHEEIDAATWAEWGIDYLKYDWCTYGWLFPKPERPDHRHPYDLMRTALDQIDRDIVYSLCQYGMDCVWEWGGEVGSQLWRTTGDITDTWSSMSTIGFDQDRLSEYASSGRWNDPDMLVVGKVGWGPTLRQTKLTPNEQITHMTLWSILAAPLLIGCDLTQLDAFTLAVLGNPEVIEVNQDTLGIQGRRVWRDGKVEVWARPLADGTQAVGLFNRDRAVRSVSIDWSCVGLSGSQPVRNLWRRRDEGSRSTYTAEIPRHGAILLKVGFPTARTVTKEGG